MTTREAPTKLGSSFFTLPSSVLILQAVNNYAFFKGGLRLAWIHSFLAAEEEHGVYMGQHGLVRGSLSAASLWNRRSSSTPLDVEWWKDRQIGRWRPHRL
jgi:hypothetical protein